MDWVLLVISSVAFVEIFIYLQTLERIKELKEILVKVVATIRSPYISDHWKEKVLPQYSLQLFVCSLLVFATLFISFVPFIAFSAFSILFYGQFIELTASLKGIIASTTIAIVYAMLISRNTEGNYSTRSKFLHQAVLQGSFFGEAIFDFERLLYASKTRDVSLEKHIFVAGLARAGTTILMRKLYENGKFCSLTYRDMPFVLAPNMWRAISSFSQRQSEMQERAHGDGLEVNYDSPEALEEVFWRTFCGSCYIKQNSLIPMTANIDVVNKFRTFIALVLKNTSDKCYLSKNNNNILRLNSIIKAFPNALIIIPFREPLQQAFSLMNQHQRFIKQHSEDPFTKKYMTWLAHHEFGADHRPFLFDENSDNKLNKENLSYWLKLWINTYSYLLENSPTQACFLSYENLCDDTQYVWTKLSDRINLEPYNESISFSISLNHIVESAHEDLILQSTELYNKLLAKSIAYRKR